MCGGRFFAVFDRSARVGIPNLIVLGAKGSEADAVQHQYLPIFSFVITHHLGRMLHYGFVCTLLNDVFGIQLRGAK